MERPAEHITPPDIDYSIPGMRIQTGGPTDPWPLIIRTAQPQRDWILEPTAIEDRVSVKETPTTILYRGQAWRILEQEENESGWIYRMKPCPLGEPRIKAVELSREKMEQIAAEQAHEQHLMKLVKISSAYEMLLGWLPARVQEELSERWLFSPEDASRKNAQLQFIIALAVCTLCVIQIVPSLLYSINVAARWLMSGTLWFYLGLEGWLRYGHVLASNRPCGFPLLELADRLMQWRKNRLRKQKP